MSVHRRTYEKRVEWYQHGRFGMFIHWGLYSMPARHEWVKTREMIPEEKYDKYFKYFNPDLFDAREWARQAKAAGMKYAVLTTKHHEGFCMFDSKYTDYKCTNTPAGRVYIKDADGITRRVSDAKADESDIPAGMPMRELQRAVYQNKVDKGFNITDINLEICLIYGELNESYDAYLNSPETVGEELADVMIYLMGLSEIVGIDLQAELERGLFEGAV